MIILIHNQAQEVHQLLKDNVDITNEFKDQSLNKTFFQLAKRFPDQLLVWCDNRIFSKINYAGFDEIFHHKLIMASYDLGYSQKFPRAIGYIEESPFINIQYEIKYPTWIMSTDIGAINTSIISKVQNIVAHRVSFFYLINSISKKSQLKGLLCYSAPNLVKSNSGVKLKTNSTISYFNLYKFVKQHYNIQWIFLLFFSHIFYERKILLASLLNSLFYKRSELQDRVFKDIKINSGKHEVCNNSIDVIIPTLNRKLTLFDVLIDLKNQTLLPVNVIIVEQKPDGLNSDLEYIENEKWPFKIKHILINKTGACNARNMALELMESEWIFFCDDDVRFEKNSLSMMIKSMRIYSSCCGQFPALRQGEKKMFSYVVQSTIFGSGNTLVKKEKIGGLRFSSAFELGYGEDLDFGMNLRNKGVDIIQFPFPEIHHLKLDSGGFRLRFNYPWDAEEIKPRPAPSVMLYKRKHLTREQILGYKNFFFITNLKKFRYSISGLSKAWDKSLYWSKKL
jgi:GT2 family glycosyltransferase